MGYFQNHWKKQPSTKHQRRQTLFLFSKDRQNQTANLTSSAVRFFAK